MHFVLIGELVGHMPRDLKHFIANGILTVNYKSIHRQSEIDGLSRIVSRITHPYWRSLIHISQIRLGSAQIPIVIDGYLMVVRWLFKVLDISSLNLEIVSWCV